MRVTLIHNPTAGDEDHSVDELVAALGRAGYEATATSSKGAEFGRALTDPGELVVVAGGDGTITKTARRLVGRGIPLAILPMGTANNIAGSFGIAGPAEEVIAGWTSARRLAFDVGGVRGVDGTVGELPFFESVGLGLFAEAMARLDAAEEAGRLPETDHPLETPLQALRHLALARRPKRWRITVDGRDRSGDYLLVEAMNIRCVGPNLALAPDAAMDDGLLELVLLEEQDRDAFVDYLERRLAGASATPSLTLHRGRRITLHCESAELHVDDEPAPEELSSEAGPLTLELGLERGALEVLVPV